VTLRVVYMGTPEFAVPALRVLQSDPRCDVVLVVSQPDRPAGRGKRPTSPPVVECARELDLPTMQPETLRDEEVVRTLQDTQADLFVVAAYGQILRPQVLALPKLGCVNIHASLLPRWRGAAPIQRAIATQDAVTGVSIMRMEKGLDTGPVYTTRTTMIRDAETAGELHDRLATIGAELLRDSLDTISDPNASPESQPQHGATYARMLSAADRHFTFDWPARQVAAHINAMSPWPCARMHVDDAIVHLRRAAPLSIETDLSPGTIVAASATDGLLIACGDRTVVEMVDVCRPGKRPMSARECLQGITIDVGATATPADA